MADQNFRVKRGLEVGIGATIINATSNGLVGIGSTIPTVKLDVVGDGKFTGNVTATTFIGAVTGIAASATQLVNPRTFEITGDVVASPIAFDGTGNVSLAATIQPNSVGLGTDTTGDYVQNISGTSNQITVTGGTGESSTPVLSLPNNLVVPQDLTVTRDLQVNRNLNVDGNITIGGSTAFINVQELKVTDPDLVLGFRTDANNNEISTDNTANHGGVAVASTEGTPLVNLFIAGIETNPATYKKIMWFKEGTFAGLGTDAWLINYAVGIGSTQFPTGTRLAAGSVQFTENDLAVVRDINASGIGTITTLTSINATLTNINSTGISTLGVTSATNLTAQQLNVSGVATVGSNFLVNSGTLYVDATNNRVGINTLSPIQPVQVGAAGTNVVVVTGIGSVGIGTTNPNTKLHIVGDLNLDDGGTYNTTLQVVTPTANRVISLPNATGIVALVAGSSGQVTYNQSGINTGDAGFTYSSTGGLVVTTLTSTTLSNAGVATFTNGPVLIGSGTSTGTTNQRLQVTGGAYVSGNLGIGFTSPTVRLQVAAIGSAGVGQTIAFFNDVNNNERISIIDETTSGQKPPGFRSRIASYGLGLYATAGPIIFYQGTSDTDRGRIDTSGNFLINATTSTGTASQRLQVTGGGYFSSSVGIGSTNPTQALDVSGSVAVSTAFIVGTLPTIRLGSNVQTGVPSVVLGSNGAVAWSNTTSANSDQNPDVRLFRDSAAVLAQRNAGIAQTFRIYNTYTSATNFERGQVGWTNNTFIVGTEKGSAGGTATQLELQTDGTTRVAISTTGSVGIGTTNPEYNLQVVGSFGATTKSFIVNHPTKPGKKLQYGSLESPYHGIRLTGKGVIENGKCVIELPEYISAFVKEDGVNIQTTNIKHGKVLWVEEVNVANNNFTIQTEETTGTYEFYWDFTAVRKDVVDLEVEL